MIMDLVSCAKSALYSGIWPSHGVQRAGNSRVTQHVGHSRNVHSLLRLNSIGEVSSENSTSQVTANKMTPKLALTESSSGTSNMIDTVANWIPFGNKIFKSRGVSGNMGLTDNTTAGLSMALVGVFGPTKRENQVPKDPSLFSKMPNSFSFSDNRMNIPNWMNVSVQQNMIVNSFNQTLLENRREKDMTSPWNQFYSQWKRCNSNSTDSASSTRSTKSENRNNSDTIGKKRQLEEPGNLQTNSTGELCSRLHNLSLREMETPHSETRMAMQKGQTSTETMKLAKQNNGRETGASTSNPYLATCVDVKCETSQQGVHLLPNSNSLTTLANETGHNSASAVKLLSSNGERKADVSKDCRSIQMERPTFSVNCDRDGINARNSQGKTSLDVAEIEPSGCCDKSSRLSAGKEKCRKAKRPRPSSKKRRRQKARQSAANSNGVSPGDRGYVQDENRQKKCRFEEKGGARDQKRAHHDEPDTSVSGCDKTPTSTVFPVPFILGVNDLGQTDHGSHTAFKLAMLIDSDESAFSEEDPDYDCDNFDISYQCDFLPCNGDLFNPVNFTVSFCVSPSTPETCPNSPFESISSHLDSINASWGVSCHSTAVKSKSSKKVSFASDSDLETIHHMVAWKYAYRSARKGPWEEYARDRQRFQRRIDAAECLLAPILQSCHREAVYSKLQSIPNSPL